MPFLLLFCPESQTAAALRKAAGISPGSRGSGFALPSLAIKGRAFPASVPPAGKVTWLEQIPAKGSSEKSCTEGTCWRPDSRKQRKAATGTQADAAAGEEKTS